MYALHSLGSNSLSVRNLIPLLLIAIIPLWLVASSHYYCFQLPYLKSHSDDKPYISIDNRIVVNKYDEIAFTEDTRIIHDYGKPSQPINYQSI